MWPLLLAGIFAAVTQFPHDPSGSVQCGLQQVTWSSTPGSATLQAMAGGSLVMDLSQELAPGERLIPLWCGDLLDDGSEVLGVETFSGGAHCCFSVSVVQLEKGGRHLLDADLGNGGLGTPEQLDDSGPLELVGGSDVFAYFDDLSFAASPFMPLVYAYDVHEYVEATRAFPGMIEADIQSAEADLPAAVGRPVAQNEPPAIRYQEQESVALRLYGLHVLLGDQDAALPGIVAQLSPPAAAWLNANASAAAGAMANVYSLSS